MSINLSGWPYRVGWTRVSDDVLVSTVKLIADHSFGGPCPLWFETMIFGGPHDEFQERYSTEAEAITGHDKAVAMAKGELRKA